MTATLAATCPRPAHLTHGTRAAYDRGCRHPEAVAAKRVEGRRWRHSPTGQATTRRRLDRELLERRYVDPVAVDQACAGRPVQLSVREKRAAIAQLTRGDMSAQQIADRLNTTSRSVHRHRAAARREEKVDVCA